MNKKLALFLCLTTVISTAFAPCNKLSASATQNNSAINYEPTCELTAQQVVDNAMGYEKEAYTYNDFPWTFGSHWCAAFVTHCMGKNVDEGIEDQRENRNRSVTSITATHVNNGSFHLRYENYTPWTSNNITTDKLEKCYDSNYTPKVGDLIVYDTNNTCPPDIRVYNEDIELEHIGIVTEVINPDEGINATVVVIEGNSLDTSSEVPFPNYAPIKSPDDQIALLNTYIWDLANYSNNIDYNDERRMVRKITITHNDAIFVYGYCSPRYASDENDLPGDVNCNGVVSAVDMSKLQCYLLDRPYSTLTKQGKRNADINSDGQINIVDVVKLKMMLLQ